MRRVHTNYYTEKAAIVLDQMRARLRQSRATLVELAEAIGKTHFCAKGYLNHLREREEVLCVVESKMRPKLGCTPAVWALNPDFVESSVPVAPGSGDQEVDRFARKVIVRQSGQWEPNHSRMAMDCYLFGLPAAWQGAAA